MKYMYYWLNEYNPWPSLIFKIGVFKQVLHKPEVFIMSSRGRVANHRSRSLYIVLNQYVYMLHEPIDDNDTVIYDIYNTDL